MSIEQLLDLDAASGLRVVPDLDGYDSVSAGWEEEEFRTFEHTDGSYGGYWRGCPGDVTFDAWPFSEVCVIISGHIVMEDAQGLRRSYRAGAAFLIPKGFSGRWITAEPSEKYFICLPG